MNSKIEISESERTESFLAPATIDLAATNFDQHGALWIKNVFSRDLIQSLAASYQKKYVSLSKKELRKRNACVGDQRFMITVDVKGAFNDPGLYASPMLLPILQKLLSVNCRIASFGSVVAFPGADDQAIHLDHPPLFQSTETCDSLSPYAITVVIPLADIEPEMGTTAIWEGTHRGGEERLKQVQSLMDSPNFAGAAQPTPRMGDAYLMDYRVIHGGMANRSESVRPILYLVYARPWFRDGFNFGDQKAISISKKQLGKVPKEFRFLFS